jgi:ribosome-binding protein aMBF1 (putative translation factor)
MNVNVKPAKRSRPLRVETNDVYTGAAALAERVATRVRAEREKRGWSVAELARRAEIAAPNVHRIEAAKHAPRASTLLRIAKALGVSISRLVNAP